MIFVIQLKIEADLQTISEDGDQYPILYEMKNP
jgi:hypothetical protein